MIGDIESRLWLEPVSCDHSTLPTEIELLFILKEGMTKTRDNRFSGRLSVSLFALCQGRVL
jgi:hypothetical protein